jgi:hypothetical protein
VYRLFVCACVFSRSFVCWNIWELWAHTFKKKILNILSARKVTWSKFGTADPRFWSTLWTALLPDAFCLMRVNRLYILEQVRYCGPAVLEQPVNCAVTWRFLLDACEQFIHFCLRGWGENCAPCAPNNRLYATQFSRSGDFKHPCSGARFAWENYILAVCYRNNVTCHVFCN